MSLQVPLLPHSAQLGTQLKLSSSLQASTCKLGHRMAILSSGTGRPSGRPSQRLRSCISAFPDQIRTKLQNLIHGIISNICHGDICLCNICPDNNCHSFLDDNFFKTKILFWLRFFCNPKYVFTQKFSVLNVFKKLSIKLFHTQNFFFNLEIFLPNFGPIFATPWLHIGFSAKLKIWQD